MGGLIVKAVAAAGVVGGGALTAQKVAGKYGSDAKKMVDTKEGVPIKFGFTTSSEVRDCARAVCETEELSVLSRVRRPRSRKVCLYLYGRAEAGVWSDECCNEDRQTV